MFCSYCKKYSHVKKSCRLLKRKMIKEKFARKNLIENIGDKFSIKIRISYCIHTIEYRRKGCTYCKKNNHSIRNRWLLKRKKLKEDGAEIKSFESFNKLLALKIETFECTRRIFLLCCKKAHQHIKRNYSSSRFLDRLIYEIDQENQAPSNMASQRNISFQPNNLRKPGVTILKEILKTIKLDERLMTENNHLLNVFLSTFIDEMKKDELFKKLFRNLAYTGSFYSDLRISEPDEFDINLILKLPFKPSDFEVHYHPQVPSYAKYRLKNPESMAIAHPLVLKKLFKDGYLMPEYVRKWIQGVVDKARQNYSLPNGITKMIPSASGPARTMKLQKYRGIIDIDLVPVISCTLETKQPGIDGRVCAKFGASLETFLVPKPYSPSGQAPVNETEIPRLWRTHFPDAEKQLIHDLGCVKPVIKLLKLLRDKENWKSLASYYLKTVVMWMILENNDKEYWKEDKLDQRFIDDILVRSSELLYHATRKRSYFGEFVISLPPLWTGDVCSEFTNDAPSKVDVHLTDRTDESTLTTKHSGGCGKEGDIVYMPLHWMKGGTEDLARQFVKQWSIYRYGVFEEDPIKNGLCFMSKTSWSPAGCYDLKVDAEPTFENGVPFCILPDDFFEKNKFKSSLMSQSNFSEILNFCDGSETYPHNPAIPTLHNNLCEGKTVWSIIESSEDFKYGKNLPLKLDTSPFSPSFKCFKEQPIQVTFAIQNSTSKEDLSAAMVELGYSLYQFLGNMLPSETKANVVLFSDNEDDSKPIELDLTNSNELERTIGFYVRTIKVVTNTCLRCGLQKALKASQAHTHPSPIVVLIAWESSLIGEKPSQLVEIVRSFLPKVRLQLILVEDTDAEVLPSSLVDAVRTTGGNIYSLPKELVFMASKLHVLLAGVVKNHLQVEDNIVVIHESTYNNITQNFIDSFSTPSNIAVEKLVYNMYCDLVRIVQEKNPNCTFEKSASTTFKCGEVRSFNNQVKSPQSLTSMTTWEYPFEYQGGTTLPKCSSVAMLLLSSSSKKPPTLRGWLSKYQISIGRDALIIYAEIAGSSDPRVSVFATVSSSVLVSPITIALLDNGNGDPDVKAEDGIYSRHFSSFVKKGTYVVSISTEISNENANSFTESDNEKSVSKLVQKKIIGSFSVLEDAPGIDILPPNRIADLNVVSIAHENSTVTLRWTAPGNNYDSGKATAYEIKYSENSASLSEIYFNGEKNAVLLSINYSTPSESGTKEILEFYFPKIDNGKPHYIALRAIDTNKNKGKISNIVQVYFNQSQSIVTETQTSSTKISNLGSTDPSIWPENENHTKDESNKTAETPTENPVVSETTTSENETPVTNIFFDKKFIIVISTAGGILLVIIIVNILVCCFCIREKKHYPEQKKLCRDASLRPPYNLNIAYKDDSISLTDNDAGVPMSTLQDRGIHPDSSARNRTRYTYHTDRSLQNNEKSPTSSELGFKLVQTLPAYATSSLSRFTAKLNDLDSETEPDAKPSAALSQNLSNVDDAHIYSLGVV